MTMTAPPATGVRHHWADLPDTVRDAVQDILGAPVVEARSQSGGFSPGVAARVRLADGGRAFVKAVSAEVNPTARTSTVPRPGTPRRSRRTPPYRNCSARTTTAPVSPSSWRTSRAASPTSPGTRPSWTASWRPSVT